MKTNGVSIVTPEREYTMQDLQNALAMFVNIAGNIIGLDATVMLLESLGNLIKEEPDRARKLADPIIQNQLLEMTKGLKGKSLNFMDIMPLISQVAKILG